MFLSTYFLKKSFSIANFLSLKRVCRHEGVRVRWSRLQQRRVKKQKRISERSNGWGPLCPEKATKQRTWTRARLRGLFPGSPPKAEPPFGDLLTLLTSAPRKVIWVCLQPWPPFLPHRAAPGAPCFLTNTCSVPECSPVTLCLKDRHRSPECMRWPRGSTKRAAFPPGALAADTVRYCPPAMGKAGPLSSIQLHGQEVLNKLPMVTFINKESQIFLKKKNIAYFCACYNAMVLTNSTHYFAHREQSQRIKLDPNTDCLLGYDQTSLRHLEALPSDPPSTHCCQATYTGWAEMTQNFPGKIYV